jgi:hypothetical protein
VPDIEGFRLTAGSKTELIQRHSGYMPFKVTVRTRPSALPGAGAWQRIGSGLHHGKNALVFKQRTLYPLDLDCYLFATV